MNGGERRLRTAVHTAPIIATKTLLVRAWPAAVPHATGRQDRARTVREAFLEIRKTTLRIQPPDLLQHKYDSVEMNVVLVSLQFEEASRLEPCLGVSLIVAWRMLFICRLGRSHPDWSCEILFDESEWKSVFCVTYPARQLPERPPSLDFILRLIGELGGWVAAPGKQALPGPQTTWIDLQRMHDFARAWNIFGPGAKNKDLYQNNFYNCSDYLGVIL